jgi:hypothetical protein
MSSTERPGPITLNKAAFVQLGKLFGLFGNGVSWPGHSCGLGQVEFEAFDQAVRSAARYNAWFTEENVRHMLRSLSAMLGEDQLNAWLARYAASANSVLQRTVGVIAAGNIPLVGFHDLLCVLLTGHRLRLKPSSDDAGLTAAVVQVLGLIAPDLEERVFVAREKLGQVDALIATGSNNTARYFEHYFRHVPRIIRKNRTSVAVLDGTESREELAALGEDIFRYFGLGCRNVSKLYVPEDFDLDRFFGAIVEWGVIAQHHKWANNYDYHKAIWLMDHVPLIENGFVLLKEDAGLHSPLGSLFYERYRRIEEVRSTLKDRAEEIQCVVGHAGVPFGAAQCPGPTDYADGVDTMRFLLEL